MHVGMILCASPVSQRTGGYCERRFVPRRIWTELYEITSSEPDSIGNKVLKDCQRQRPFHGQRSTLCACSVSLTLMVKAELDTGDAVSPRESSNDRRSLSNHRLIQSILAGVNHIPFAQLDKKVVVCSNASAYSDEVAEYAWSLLLTAAKRIVDFHNAVKTDQWTLRRTLGGKEVTILEQKTLGILGYGGIGSAVAR